MDSLGYLLESAQNWLDAIPIPQLEGESPTLQFVGKAAYLIYQERKTVLAFIHVLAAAVFPIYIGSHASLRCPPSAMEPGKSVVIDCATDEDENNDLEELEDSALQGLTPFDALLFPLVAACVLTALYFLIKWLEDPQIISKVLGWYFSFCSVFAVGNLISDSLNVGTSFIFPSFWSSGDQLSFIDQAFSKQLRGEKSVTTNNESPSLREESAHNNSFPGRSLMSKLPEMCTAHIWAIRDLFLRRWIFRGYIRGGLLSIKSRVRLNDIIGQLLAIAAIAVYNMNGKTWWLSNLMSFGLCYSAIRFLSPTTFWTGSLVLVGLLVYDIFMVFYTPMMITVATSLDVPIKLVFPGGGILGLGDIVLPGLMIALALRFDLYLHYLCRQDSASSLPPSGLLSKTKPIYYPATGHWGERFWTSSLQRPTLPHQLAGFMFRKTYFYASLVGYTIGMIATYTVLIVFEHGQPALMYLVPTVLVSLWATAAVRGDLVEMWKHTERDESERPEVQGKSARGQRDSESLINMKSAVVAMRAGVTTLQTGLLHVQAMESSIETMQRELKKLEATLDGFLHDSNAEQVGKVGVAKRAESKGPHQKGESESKATSAGKAQSREWIRGTHARGAAHHIFFFSLSAPARTPIESTVAVI